MSKIVLEAQNIEKHFTDGKSTVEVIKGLSLQVKAEIFCLSQINTLKQKQLSKVRSAGISKPTKAQYSNTQQQNGSNNA